MIATHLAARGHDRGLAERHPIVAGLLLTLALVLLFALASTPPAGADVCSRGNVPAATLLVPYFEVDLADPGGRTTLLAIGSTSPDPTLVKVTLWSDWGVPVWGFFVHLAPDAVQTMNFRDVVGRLQVPSLSEADIARFPGCFSILLPVPGPTPEDLQRRLTGKPDPDGTCYARPREGSSVAVGFVTVDVVRDCDLTLPTPLDPTYGALALEDNVLWGDVLYVAPDDESAQGFSAVSIRADPDADLDPYWAFYPYLPGLHRLPPDVAWRGRFLAGGPLATETELVVWMRSFLTGPVACASGVDQRPDLAVRWGPESGPLGMASQLLVGTATAKLPFSDSNLGPLPIAGSFELTAWLGCASGDCPPEPQPIPFVLWQTHRAAGRFSVGVEATPVDGPCSAVP